MVEQDCSLTVLHCSWLTVSHCSSCAVLHCWVVAGARALRAEVTRLVMRGWSADTTEVVTASTEEEELLVLLEVPAEVPREAVEVREARSSAIFGPIWARTSPTTCCSLICGAAAAAATIRRRSLGEAMAGSAGPLPGQGLHRPFGLYQPIAGSHRRGQEFAVATVVQVKRTGSGPDSTHTSPFHNTAESTDSFAPIAKDPELYLN
jgi:hypothetical protein